MLLKGKDCPEITLKRQKGCGPLFFAATVPSQGCRVILEYFLIRFWICHAMISCLCKSLYFHIFLTNAVVISLQKPPLCGGGADELWSNRDPILSFTSKYPQIRTIPNILIISTDSHNSKYPHIMISQDLRNIYNYPQHNQRSKEYQKAAKSKQ